SRQRASDLRRAREFRRNRTLAGSSGERRKLKACGAAAPSRGIRDTKLAAFVPNLFSPFVTFLFAVGRRSKGKSGRLRCLSQARRYLAMFEESLMESSAHSPARRGWTTLMAIGLQISVLSAVLLFQALHPAALPAVFRIHEIASQISSPPPQASSQAAQSSSGN